MLKIRIAGSEGELRQIAHKLGTTHIKRFKRDNGKTVFAMDVQISVKDFLNNMDLKTTGVVADNAVADKSPHEKCNPRELQEELEELLHEIADK